MDFDDRYIDYAQMTPQVRLGEMADQLYNTVSPEELQQMLALVVNDFMPKLHDITKGHTKIVGPLDNIAIAASIFAMLMIRGAAMYEAQRRSPDQN